MSEPVTPSPEGVDPESYYALLGGDAGVRALTERFYVHMDTLPEAATIRAMHPKNLTPSVDKLYEFLSGFLGGPPLYWQRRGHPRLRMRHMPFAVDRDAARAWTACMRLALAETELSPLKRTLLEQRFAQVADFMRNQPD